jgi:cytoskeletal protein CcmA (bactofilin family)
MRDHIAAVIGKGMIIKGSIHSRQDIILNGSVEGDLDVENYKLTIGPEAKVSANAKAREVDIQGSIDGDVQSTDKISIRTGGRLVGNIRTAGIVIEEGAFFKGTVDIVNARADKAAGGA